MIISAILIALSGGAALAQPGPLTPAPVPGIDDGRLAPVDRAGASGSVANQAPFSAAPSNMVPGGGQPALQSIETPDSRRNAPVPAITK